MSTPHELSDDFPGKADRIRHLKETDAHFRRLADDYHTTNRAVHRAETRAAPVSEEEEQRLRRDRARLKDEIARMLA